MKRLYSSKDKSLSEKFIITQKDIQNELKDISLYDNFDESQANNILQKLQARKELVDQNKASWDKYYQTLKDGEQWQIDFVKNTDLQTASTQDVIKAQKAARDGAIAYNAGLKQMTVGAKATSMALKGLTLAANIGLGLLISWGLPKLIELIDNAYDSYDELNEKIEENRQEYEDATKEIENLNSELEATKDRIEELNRLDSLSVVEQDELKNLQKYNAELERSIKFEEKRQEAALQNQIDTISKKYSRDNSFDTSTTLDEIERLEEKYNKKMRSIEGAAKLQGLSTDDYLGRFFNELQELNDIQTQIQDLKNSFTNSEAQDYKFDYIENLENEIKAFQTKGIENLSVKEKKVYTDMLKELDNTWRMYFTNAEYFEFQIDPIFKTDGLDGLKDKMIDYFADDGTKESLAKYIGTNLDEILRQACEESYISYDALVDALYGEGTNNYDYDKAVNSIVGSLTGVRGDFSMRRKVLDATEDMKASEIKILLGFADSNGNKYNSVEDFFVAFDEYKNKEIDLSTSFSLTEAEITAIDDYKKAISSIKDAYTDLDNLSTEQITSLIGCKFTYDNISSD